MSDGLSDANRAPDYTRDPVFGTCNNCGKGHCRCAQDRVDFLEAKVVQLHEALGVAAGALFAISITTLEMHERVRRFAKGYYEKILAVVEG